MPHRTKTARRAAGHHRVFLPTLCWNRRRADFYAVTDGLLPEGIRFRSAIVPGVDEDLNCSIRHVGHVEGRVVRADGQLFVVRVRAQPPTVARIARDLLSLSRQQAPAIQQVRAHPRVVPRTRNVVVHLPCGRSLIGKLLNVSATGAALATGEPVAPGTVLTIGGTRARTMRQLEHGIGVAFLEPLDPDRVNRDIVL